MTSVETTQPTDTEHTEVRPVLWEGPPPKVRGQLLPFGKADVETIKFIAHNIAASSDRHALPPGIENPEQAFMVMLWGAERGLQVTTALANVSLINGRAYPGTELLYGMVTHQDPSIQVHFVERTLERAEVTVERDGRDPVNIVWTVDDAKAAGLIDEAPDSRALKSPWYKYRRRMLTWRALREALQLIAPDLLAGLGLPEVYEEAERGSTEVTVEAPWGQPVIDQEPAGPDPDVVAGELAELFGRFGVEQTVLRPEIDWRDGDNVVQRVVQWLQVNPGSDLTDLLRRCGVAVDAQEAD